MNGQVLWAIFKRDFLSYFGSPLGYVFVIFFVFLAGWGTFRFDDTFFTANEATLHLLSDAFPYLLVVFVPGITMAAWAGERRLGTDELLHTLPARDPEVVLAKFGAALGIYTVALLFTLSNVAILAYLGDPDAGLVVANYVGYWLLGAALVAAGMLASALTRNLTVAYVVGFLFCAVPVGLHHVAGLVPGRAGDIVGELSAIERYGAFTRGAVSLEDVVYFAALTAALLYANAAVLGRRLWPSRSLLPAHRALRLASVLVAGMSLAILAQRTAARADATEEGLLSLNPQVVEILDGIEADRPVFIQAWFSEDLSGPYARTRDELVRILDELDAEGGERVEVAIRPTELYSEEAEAAKDSFGIEPRTVSVEADGRQTEQEAFLGLAFTCGAKEEVISFFDPGLPVQYELARAVGVVAEVERAKVGVLETGVEVFGSFDFQTRRQQRSWQVLEELRKQYEVEQVEGVAEIDTSVDVLLCPMPSTLPQPKMDRLAAYLYQGGRALFLCDPFPGFDLSKAPSLSNQQRNPFQQRQRQPQQPEKGDLEPLLQAMGVRWPSGRVVWDDHNPHPKFDQFNKVKEYVFVVRGDAANPSGFNEDDQVTAGLQEVLCVFPGDLEPLDREEVEVTPLLRTRPASGFHSWSEMVESHPLLGPRPKPASTRRYVAAGERRVLAVRSSGRLRAPASQGAMKEGEVSEDPFEAIVVADADVAHDFVFNLRKRTDEIADEFQLDNVTFLSNCIDSLAGEEAYLELRKHRPEHRTLTRLEDYEQELREQRRQAAEEASEEAEAQLEDARQRLDEAIAGIEEDASLDYRTKAIQKRYVTEREQRKLEAQELRIENEESAKVRRVERRNKRRLKLEQNRIRVMAIAVPPLPVLLLGLIVLITGKVREMEGAEPSRRR